LNPWQVRARLNKIYQKHTGQLLDKIERSMERDLFMSPEEAKEFGLIDEIIEHRPASLVTEAIKPSDDIGRGGDNNKGAEEAAAV
jgi:ATP-dependent Clp protease, protease subunit